MSGGSIGVVEDRTWALRGFRVVVSAVGALVLVLVLVLVVAGGAGEGSAVSGSGEPLLDAFCQGLPQHVLRGAVGEGEVGEDVGARGSRWARSESGVGS